MSTISLKDAKAGFSNIVDQAAAGEFVTITRHGRAAAVLVSVRAAEAARKALHKERPSLVQYLRSFPADIDLDDDVFARNPAPSREVDL
ncbi:type II toxin-antitoxin system Phd/YefM family antitoxin [Sinorhizobium terangae]|uniref:Antitoxin n=1 Tax=Sinorhizobium terangae TaxID=110322 RepID=A0A6N7LDY9_SINTE|nr:type II toxin-antitoxin system Phd/YefM family antitoxin [Sinorhizobium terangae]MBB4186455.1 prevent-host-death family protein [Sinorhizobium terangae]MQX16057.1 type II toxin-antitoxin system prevent-host-death family antitoxin [Sinorhizobium terangae]WFU50919.1 type II toxin-antitoxin system Phd/YefM family antitoxin [Sinorhizobium terangae]